MAIINASHRWARSNEEESRSFLPPGGGGGDNDDMDARIKALETAMLGANDRLTKIETKLDHMPTKADLSDALHSQTRWVIGTAIALAAVAFAAAKLL